MADRNASIILSLRNQADPEVRKLAASFRDLIVQTKQAGSTQEQAERQALSHASALARLATTSGNAAQGERILAAALSQVDRESTAAVRAETQLVVQQQRIAQEAARTQQALQQQMDAMRASLAPVQSSANGLISTLQSLKTAAGGIGIALGAQQLAAFEIGAVKSALSLREAQNALRAVAGDTRLYTEALSTARRQQVLFGGSLQENIEGLQGLTIVSRSTGAELQSLVDLAQRLVIKSPEQGIGGARIALTEALEEGNIVSLSRRFEIPKEALERLKNTALPVGERLKVIDEELNRIGITSAAVAGKIDADALALRQLGANAESLKNALGNQLANEIGPTVSVLNRLTGAAARAGEAGGEAGKDARAFTAAFTESAPLIGTFLQSMHLLAGEEQSAADITAQLTGGHQQLTNVISALIPPLTIEASTMARIGDVAGILSGGLERLTGAQQAAAREIVNTSAVEAAQTAQTKLLEAQTNRAVDAFLSLHPNVNAVGAAFLVATGRADPLIVKLALLRQGALDAANALAAIDPSIIARGLADQRAGERSGGAVRTQEEADRLGRLNALQGDYARRRAADNKRIADQSAADAKRIRDAQQGLDLARAKSSAQRIAVLQKELAGTTDIAERLRIQAQIEQEKNRTAKAHTSELDKQLSLNERIADSQAKQARAAIDARLALIDDAKQRILEEKELATAQNAARNARDPRFRRLAELAAERIPLEQQRRVLDIQEKLATAQGDIVKGRIIQGQRGAALPGALPPLPPIPPLAPPVGGVGGVNVPLAGGGGITVQFVVDGKVIANAIIPRIMDAQRTGLRGAVAGGV